VYAAGLAVLLLLALPAAMASAEGGNRTYQQGRSSDGGAIVEVSYSAADQNLLTCGGGYGGCTILVGGVVVAGCDHFNACSYAFPTATGTYPATVVRFILNGNVGGEPYAVQGQNISNGTFSNHWAAAIQLLPPEMSASWFMDSVRSVTTNPLLGSILVYGIAMFLTFAGIGTVKRIVGEFFSGKGKVINGGKSRNPSEGLGAAPSPYMDETSSRGRVGKSGDYRVD
jgi:hypothetical protein